MAFDYLVHQPKRFRRRRSLIYFGPEAINVVVENSDLTCMELLSHCGVHNAQFLGG